uniref:Uncharacterized protein n=1 Tax=Rhizophora mucronata TaxID=61149 RepID=A0A2P2N6U8_RHIMU
MLTEFRQGDRTSTNHAVSMLKSDMA